MKQAVGLSACWRGQWTHLSWLSELAGLWVQMGLRCWGKRGFGCSKCSYRERFCMAVWCTRLSAV